MHRKTALLIICIAALLTPAAAPAYPNADARHSLTARGASWTVFQDHKDPLLWHYVPAVARLELAGPKEPLLVLMKYQIPSQADAQKLEETAVTAFTLTLKPETAAAQELAAAICALPRMQGVSADPKAVKLESVPLTDVKVSLFDGNGGLLAEAPAAAGIGGADTGAVKFSLRVTPTDSLQELLLRGEGLKLSLDFGYTAGSPKPTALRGQAAGVIGLGMFPKDVQDKSVIIFPAGTPEMAVLQLPPVNAGAELQKLDYQVALEYPKTKGMQQDMVSWSRTAKAGPGWRDSRGNLRQFLMMPLKQCLALAAKDGKGGDECFFKTRRQLTQQGRQPVIIESTQPVFSGGLPFAESDPGYSAFSVSGEYLTLDAQDPPLMAVRLTFNCGKENAIGQIKTAGGVLTGDPVTAYFTKDCGQVKLNITYISKTGKASQRTIADLRKEPGGVLYLEDPAQ